MTHQEARNGSGEPGNENVGLGTPPEYHKKPRPRSSQGFQSVLSPSPLLIDSRRASKDDLSVASGPVTPKRSNIPPRGLSLQMPPRDISSTSTANLTKRIPVSPKPETAASYPSPSSVLPRRSRGLDFSRAATNLHHSILAESSPESSPIVGSRGSMMPRKGLFSPPSNPSVPESPNSVPNSLWSTMANVEKTGLSSSVGSSSVMEYDSGSTSSDGDEVMDNGEDDDTIHMTPYIHHIGNGSGNPFGSVASSPGGDGIGAFSPAVSKLMSYQRHRVKSRRKRMSSSSASGQSSLHSPGPSSPPLLRSIESSLSMNGGYFLDDPSKKEINSRRESLSLGTNEMQLSDAEQSDGEGLLQMHSHEDVPIPTPVTPTMDDRRNVIRRAVTRRGNMLPKTKGFARIRAALLEEGAPLDSEVRREAEVIRQVRESDADSDLSLHPSQPATTASSPNLTATAGPLDILENISEDPSRNSEENFSRRSSSAFSHQAIRNSGGSTFWNNFDERMRTPPPIIPRESSAGVSDDMNMDTAVGSVQSSHQTTARSSISHESLASTTQTTIFEMPKKGSNKRMRDDDFDPNYFKRRAVSPGLSLQNSPILPQSPLQRDGGWWGTPKSNREVPSVHVSGDRVSSTGSNGSMTGPGGPSKRVGLQGMTDTHDGLMNMSIE
ncbi:MAG: hypothetical protein ASARMPREDX12_001564 [Alectoria sarmentosa]|nr:MAG: hypothetical protein ASARMPREDX12_001564 [Alectoria sarmentosa]